MIDLGDVVPLSVEITDSDGALADGGTVALTVTLPDGTTEIPTVTHDSTGKYHTDYVPDTAGRYVARWLATGANASSYVDVFDVADSAVVGVIGLTRAKDHLNVTVSTYDAELRTHIEAATRVAEYYCGPVAVRSYAETVEACGYTFALSRYPVVSLTSITSVLPGPAYDVDSWTVDAETGTARANVYRPLWGPVTVVYTAGRTTVPANIQMAAEIIIKHLWDTQRGGTRRPGRGRNDDSVEQELVRVAGYAVPRRAVELLSPDGVPGVG